MLCVLLIIVNFQLGLSALWPKGIVHYTINSKDYDAHSQDILTSTLSAIQQEVCIKFFNTPLNYTPSEDAKILYISNPDKRKDCFVDSFNYTGSVVDMIVGYKCLNTVDITRMVVAMLKAGIQQTVSTVNSVDLMKKFEAEERDGSTASLLTPSDRNYINRHYARECSSLDSPVVAGTRRSDGDNEPAMTKENVEYYSDKLWPLGVVMYDVEDSLRNTPFHSKLKYAMSTIELSSCVVFQEMQGDDVLVPKSLLYFVAEGADAPKLGFSEENQTISLWSMDTGAAGHSAHTLNLLFRALGVPMMSNRADRDNYIIVHWNKVTKGKEHYLERAPSAAWIRDARVPYDFDSVTHAPANYMCDTCNHGGATVTPAQDILWQRTLSMGHRTDLSEGDKELLNLLYGPQCQERYVRENQ